MENPSVDDVLSQVAQAIDTGLASVPITDLARQVVPTRYRQSFENRLGRRPDAWEKDGEAVLNAATQLGIIARAIASLRQKDTVELDMMETAADVVESECTIGFKEGKWCTRAEDP